MWLSRITRYSVYFVYFFYVQNFNRPRTQIERQYNINFRELKNMFVFRQHPFFIIIINSCKMTKPFFFLFAYFLHSHLNVIRNWWILYIIFSQMTRFFNFIRKGATLRTITSAKTVTLEHTLLHLRLYISNSTYWIVIVCYMYIGLAKTSVRFIFIHWYRWKNIK